MAYVGDVFDAAMGIMDELDAEGGAQTADTAEYMLRAPRPSSTRSYPS